MKLFHLLRKVFISLFLTLIVWGCFAQNKDELVRPSKNYKSDSLETQKLIHQIDTLYKEENFSKALELIEKAIPSCEGLRLFDDVAHINITKGAIHRINDEYVNALKAFSVALKHYQKSQNIKGIASVQNHIGAVYRLQGKYPTALEYYFNSLKSYQSIKNDRGVSTILNNIGIVYLYQKEYDKALDYYFRSLKLEEKLNDEEGIGISYLNIGEAFQKKKEYSRAIDYYLKSLKISENQKDLDAIGVNYNEIGSIYTEQNNLSEAKIYLDQALQAFTKLGSKSRQAECHLYFGQYYTKTKNFNQAIYHLKTALDLAKEAGAAEFYSNAHLKLSEVYETIRIPSEAYQHYKAYISSRDSLFNKENTRRSVQAEMLYQFERQQEVSKVEQTKKDVIYTEKANRQRLFRNFLIITLCLSSILIIFIYTAYRNKQKANKILAEQQNEILEKNEELLQQQEEILAQRDEIEKKNLILERSKQIIAAKNDRIISSIEYAQSIQQAILPHEDQLNNFFNEHFVVFLPKDIVSGDFYWFSETKDHVFAAVIDCTGHGVPGSFMSLIGNTLLNQIVNEWHMNDPALILEHLHQNVRKALQQHETHSKSHASMDVCLVKINFKTRTITFAGASRPLYIIQNGVIQKIQGDPKSAGGFQREEKRYFTNHEFALNGTSYIYLTSDGYTDQMNPKRRKLGPKLLTNILLDNHTKPMNKQKEILINTLEIFKEEEEQIDDICILGLKV